MNSRPLEALKALASAYLVRVGAALAVGGTFPLLKTLWSTLKRRFP